MKQSKMGWAVAAAVAMAFAGAVVTGTIPRVKQREALAKAQEELAKPRRVRVAIARRGDDTSVVTLPATSAPFSSAMLYARAQGFVRQNLVDVGEHVRAGQVLALVDLPEVGEQVRLASAQVKEAEANVLLAEEAAERAKKLAQAGIVSQQQEDEARARANSAVAAVSTRRAELQRLVVVQGYQEIVAPFDGVIARRGTDPGALVGVGAGGSPLFEIARVDTLRVFIDVPDAYAGDVKPELPAEVFAPRDPGKKVSGKVIRTSGVLDPTTRTLRTEVQVPGGTLLPGSFVYVRIALPRAEPPVVIAASALVVRKEGTLVARVVGSKITMVRVVLGRDLGKEIETIDGLQLGDVLVANAPDTLDSGQEVVVVEEPSR